MIAFDLNCSNGHPFEGWFSSAADFDTQKSNGMLACPLCADVHIHKALSVPNVPRKGNQRAMRPPAVVASQADATVPTPAAAEGPSPALVELVQKLARAQTEMLDNSQWVGGNFAEAARAIHYGEEPDRLIHGETSTGEAKALADEGIGVAPLLFPVVPPSAKN
ncbi:MAG: DUF1178 family protein [Sphingorhabdus sp.]|jgi:hypothetical protein|uniref:DUF1178 family protein n=1 Tax=Sphingorhabdus sp. TaxID=1902408 RepID=UPI00273D15F1|nr:DUF1178 family protein [Sphingorhabdus sp.]MDP4757922.1 DUF1178 family protein [Sphingorhabdus sp.]MDP4873074.1 DUF1178 family protein [Sphingorhabdus sp.]MDP4927930.1 DUF1178 family protein [Sphingorhabdus sp.]